MPSSSSPAVAAVAAVAAIAGCGAARGRSAGQLLTPDSTGWVDVSTTGTTGINGFWYAIADTQWCVARGHPPAACSMLVTPPAAGNFPPTADLGMCAMGVVAQVINGPDGQPDFNNIWGVHIGFNFNGGTPYDAPAHGVTGLAFHIDSEPAQDGEMLVLLSTAATGYDSPAWGGATADTAPVHIGRNEFRWPDVGGPHYIPEPPPFDPTQILSIEFGVKEDQFAPKSFAFCISALTALRD